MMSREHPRSDMRSTAGCGKQKISSTFQGQTGLDPTLFGCPVCLMIRIYDWENKDKQGPQTPSISHFVLCQYELH